MKRTTLALMSCVVVGLLASTTQAREWTNKKGEKVDAEYVGVEAGKVKLRSNRDGTIYTYPIESLSEADQMLIGDDLFSQKIRENPDKQELYIQRAHAQMNRGNYQSAVRDFNYLVKLNPKNAEAYDGRGEAYSKMEKPLQAHKDFEKAIELDAQLASAYRHRGENYKQLANTSEGKIMVDEKVEKYRQSYQAARREQLRSKGWQPLNSTSGNISRYSAIGMLAKADYELAERIEDGYDIGKCGCGAGGVGVGGGYGVGIGKGVGVATGVGYGDVKADAPLAVYPAQVVQGETITLVANKSELAKGMPQKLGADGKPIRSAYGTSANAKMEIGNVDFYRDVNGNAELDIDEDMKLGTDSDGSDGYSLEVSTAQFPPGPSRYFATPEACETCGLGKEDLTALAKNLDTAAETEKKIAAQAASAGESAGLTAEQAEQLQKDNQDEVSEVASDAFKQLRTTLPEVADLVGEAAKPVRAVGNLMKAAGQKPGEESKEKAASAAEKAEAAAEQLAAAAAKIREMAESGELPKAQGKPVAAAGEILPKEGQVAQGPPAKPGPGGPGNAGPGNDDGNYDDDDDVVVIDEDDDDVVVLDDDDDVVVIRDRDDDDRVVVIDDDDYDRVVEDYDRVLVDDPDNVVVRRDRAGAYLTGGSYDYAIRDYDVLLQQQQQLTVQQQIDFYYNRGCAHLAAGQLDNAIADFTASIQLKETGPLAYMAFNNRGIAYAKKGDYTKALVEFNSAIAINGNDALAYKNRALAYKKLGKTAEAEADMNKYSNLLSSL